MDVSNFFASNIPLFSICLVLILISIRNFKVRKKESIYFLIFTGILLILSVVVVMEQYASVTGNIYLATIFTSIGYAARPVLILIFILLANMNEKRSIWHYRVFIGLLCINALVYVIPWFFNVPWMSTAVFHYELVDGKAVFQYGGFLNYSFHAISLFFLVVLIYFSIASFQGKHRRDGIVLILCGLIILATVITEMVLQRTDLLNIISGICIMIDYIFIISINASRDPLTRLYDRRTYYEDLTKYQNLINGIIHLDMNELKYYNDNYGHEAGDEALVSLANIFTSSIVSKNMCAYRLSGDEFLILMFQGKKEQLDEVVNNIKEQLSTSKYSAAMGSYFIEKGDNTTFDEAMKKAEKLMYKDKNEYYIKSGHDRRGR